MLALKSVLANAFLGEYVLISRGTIHPAAEASGLSLPLRMKKRNFSYCIYEPIGSVRQEVASQIARMLLLPFGVILLWYALAATLGCKAHRTI
jgi:hypothetical protein